MMSQSTLIQAYQSLQEDLSNHDNVDVREIKKVKGSTSSDTPYAVTKENAMTYHFKENGSLKFEGSWGYHEIEKVLSTTPWLKHTTSDDKELELFIFDQPQIAMQYGCFTHLENDNEKLSTVYFYKKGTLVETTLTLETYLHYQVACMGVLYWPLLFAKETKDTESLNWEIQQVKKAVEILEVAFPQRDLSIFKEAVHRFFNQ